MIVLNATKAQVISGWKPTISKLHILNDIVAVAKDQHDWCHL